MEAGLAKVGVAGYGCGEGETVGARANSVKSGHGWRWQWQVLLGTEDQPNRSESGVYKPTTKESDEAAVDAVREREEVGGGCCRGALTTKARRRLR